MLPAAEPPPDGGSLRAIATLLGLYALMGGFVSFIGWVIDLPVLTDWHRTGNPGDLIPSGSREP